MAIRNKTCVVFLLGMGAISACSTVDKEMIPETPTVVEKFSELIEPVVPEANVKADQSVSTTSSEPGATQEPRAISDLSRPAATEPIPEPKLSALKRPGNILEENPTPDIPKQNNQERQKTTVKKAEVVKVDANNGDQYEPFEKTERSASSPNAETAAIVDISDQFDEIIDGVPIIRNPQKCGQGDLEIGVVVNRVPSSKGMIVADLHNDVPEDFLKWDKVILRVFAPALKGETKFCMPLTQPGDYALVTYHDKNGNNSFDRNFLGIPKERFGASGNPKVRARAPSYEETRITVPENGSTITIKLHKASDILGGK